MKRYALRHPAVFGFLIFLIVFLGGSIAGILVGMSAMAEPCEAPCDGGAMAASVIWPLSIAASLIMGLIVSGLACVGIKNLRK